MFTLLIVSDAALRPLLKLYLERDGMSVHAHAGLESALPVLEARRGNIGLVVADAWGDTAKPLFDRVRSIAPDTPVLLVGGRRTPADLPSRAGCKFLSLPFRREQLNDCVRELSQSTICC